MKHEVTFRAATWQMTPAFVKYESWKTGHPLEVIKKRKQQLFEHL
jgi:hypothetical protein